MVVFINIDMEQYTIKDLTLAALKRALEDKDLDGYPHVGIAMQAYLRDCLQDLEGWATWCKKQKRSITVRLVKGAYWDYETILARQNDWPIPVFTEKRATDANFERCSEFILRNHEYIKLALGSHNIRSISNALVHARREGVLPKAIEIQMLFGMAEPIKKALVAQGYRVRDYVPIGELIPGMAYLVRRLLENTSNESWLRQKFVQGADFDTLMADPKTFDIDRTEKNYVQAPVFTNQAPARFFRETDRKAMQDAIHMVRKQLPVSCLPHIGKQKVDTKHQVESINPSNPKEVVGKVFLADVAHAEKALTLARKAQPGWEDLGPEKRADVILRASEIMKSRNWELSALMVLEQGKPWNEAFNDTNEAIDFLRYYALEMKRIGKPQRLMQFRAWRNQPFVLSSTWRWRGHCSMEFSTRHPYGHGISSIGHR